MYKESLGSRLFDVLNYLLLGLFALSTLLPFLYILAGSFISTEEYISRKLMLFPRRLRLKVTNTFFPPTSF